MPPMNALPRTWKYQSYRPNPGSVAADRGIVPAFVPWSPPGVVTVKEGWTEGTLVFTLPPPTPGAPPGKLPLALTIRYTDGNPATLSVSAVVHRPGGEDFTNELFGWFVPASLGQDRVEADRFVVRGSIVQTSTDIAPIDPQPAYTTGFFVMEPVPASS